MKADKAQKIARKSKQAVTEEIVGLVRRHSIAVMLFHQAVAERVGLGPTDHKCLDLLREHGTMSGSDLAAITGLTTGAITGVVAKLEQAGFLHRKPDPHDGRKQILQAAPEGMQNIHAVFGPLRKDMAELLEGFDADQLAAVAEFLLKSTDLIYCHMALLRSDTRHRKAGSQGSQSPH